MLKKKKRKNPSDIVVVAEPDIRAAKGSGRVAKGSIKLEQFPIVNAARAMPASCDQACFPAWIRLPDQALPRIGAPMTGKHNYTLHSPTSNAVVEVQLLQKLFYLKKKGDGGRWTKEDGSPTVPWIGSGGVLQAWDVVTAKSGW